MNFEIIIADDGSSASFTEQLEKELSDYPFQCSHIWQEDKTFRKNRILNKSILAAGSEYLLFVDGDCVPHPKFVEEHLSYARAGTILTGRRVNLSEKITSLLTPAKVREGCLQSEFYRLVADGLFGASYDVEKGIYIKSIYLRKKLNSKLRGLLGCNFSACKKDILVVNGFDERYEAPSVGEDTDIQFRFELAGKSIRSINNIAVQYHLYHKLQERPQRNIDLFEKVKKEKRSFTPYGIISKL